MDVQSTPSASASLQLEIAEKDNCEESQVENTELERAIVCSDESKYMTGRRLHLTSAGLLVAVFLVQMEASVISTALVDITDQLAGYDKSSWLFTAYFITYSGQ